MHEGETLSIRNTHHQLRKHETVSMFILCCVVLLTFYLYDQFTFISFFISYLLPAFLIYLHILSLCNEHILNTYIYITSCSQHSFFLQNINNTAVVLFVESLQAVQLIIISTCHVETTTAIQTTDKRGLKQESR